MSRYTLEITKSAAGRLRALQGRDLKRIIAALELLRRNPRPPSSRKLRNRPGYRVRVGDYRIIYEIRDDIVVILVLAIGHRRDVYR